MKKQFLYIKNKYPTAIVLLRQNGCVHTFDDDESTLTKVCYLHSGFQDNLIDFVLRMLTKAGYKVAIAEALQ